VDANWQRAVAAGDAERLRELLEAGANVDAKDRYGQTALMLAARNGHLEAVRLLLEYAPDLDHTAKYHLSAVMLAAINDRLEIVELLVEAGAELRTTGSGAPGFHEKTALDIAEDLNRVEIAALLRRHMGGT